MTNFIRESRYVVLKNTDIQKLPVAEHSDLTSALAEAEKHMPQRTCVVVESDWPEYPIVWKMIEDRCNGVQSKDINQQLLAALTKISKLDWSERLIGLDRPTDFAERQAALFAFGDAVQIARKAIAVTEKPARPVPPYNNFGE